MNPPEQPSSLPLAFRRGNEKVAAHARRIDPLEQWDFVCECGACSDFVRLTLAEYDALRRRGGAVLIPRLRG